MRYYNGSQWDVSSPVPWTALGGVVKDLTLLAYANPAAIGGIAMTLFAVWADNSTIAGWNFNGTSWAGPATWTSGYKNVSAFNTSDGGAYVLYLGTSNSALYSQRFTGTGFSGIVQQTVQPWLAAAGANFKDEGDPPFEHNVSNDDCRVHGPTPVYTVQFADGSTQDYFAQAVNLAEVLYNEARSETIGAIDMVGWTVRDRAFQGMKTKRESNGNIIACDSYVGGVNSHSTCASLPCNQSNPDLCTNNNTRWYCCAMHGATPFGASHYQFNDGHVPFSTVYYGGFLDEAVALMSNFIPEPSTKYVPQGAFSCTFTCGTKIDDPNPVGPNCLRDIAPPVDAFSTAAPEGPMEYLAYDYCAKTSPSSSIPLLSCKRYTADYCGNTPPVQLNPGSACGQYTHTQSQGDNFFWSRVKP